MDKHNRWYTLLIVALLLALAFVCASSTQSAGANPFHSVIVGPLVTPPPSPLRYVPNVKERGDKPRGNKEKYQPVTRGWYVEMTPIR